MTMDRLPPIIFGKGAQGSRESLTMMEATESQDEEKVKGHSRVNHRGTKGHDGAARGHAFCKRKSMGSVSDSEVADAFKSGSSVQNRNRRKTQIGPLPVIKDARRASKPEDRQRPSQSRAASLVSEMSLLAFRKFYLANHDREEDRRSLARRQSMPPVNLLYKQGQVTSDQPPIPVQRVIRTPLLPSQPRFAATLSEAAQFATLQCYEDKLLESLERNHPSSGGYRWLRLRTKTPNVARIGREEGDDMREGRNDGVHNDSGVVRLATPARSDDRNGNKRAHRKQLQVTYRLELAMDMMDKLREERGELPLSPRRREDNKDVDPVQYCEDWIRGWKHEFPAVLDT